MVNKDKVKPAKVLVCQLLDGTGNMIGEFSSAGAKIKEVYPMGMKNHCACQSAVLPAQSIFKTIDFMCNFKSKLLEIVKLMRKVPHA